MAENEAIKWYIIHTYSGYENKVKSSLEKIMEHGGMSQIVEVCVPTEEVVEIKNGKRRTVQHKLMPGYVLVRMELTNESWFVVRNTRGVTGFVGAGNKPSPLSDAEFERLMTMQERTETDIRVGDTVRMLTGMFENMTGRVKSIDLEANRITVVVPLLSKESDVELAYDEVVPAKEEE